MCEPLCRMRCGGAPLLCVDVGFLCLPARQAGGNMKDFSGGKLQNPNTCFVVFLFQSLSVGVSYPRPFVRMYSKYCCIQYIHTYVCTNQTLAAHRRTQDMYTACFFFPATENLNGTQRVSRERTHQGGRKAARDEGQTAVRVAPPLRLVKRCGPVACLAQTTPPLRPVSSGGLV